MKQYCLKIRSKNEKSLKNFLLFFFKHLKTKFSIIQKSKTVQTNRKIITFLKSPHVNKTAQEHFEVHLFTEKVLVTGSYLEKNLIFLKKVLTKLFQDVSIHLELIMNEKRNKKNNLSLLNPNNFNFSKKKSFGTNFKRYKQKNLLKKTYKRKSSIICLIKLLTTINVFGEVSVISSLKKQYIV